MDVMPQKATAPTRSCPGSRALLRRAAVSVVGGATTLVGIALLVLPGPGFVFIAAGLTLLATEYDWARRPLGYATAQARRGIDEVASSPARAGLAMLAGFAFAGAGAAILCGWRPPLASTASGVLLILSGVFIVSSTWYAMTRRSGRSSGRSNDLTSP